MEISFESRSLRVQCESGRTEHTCDRPRCSSDFQAIVADIEAALSADDLIAVGATLDSPERGMASIETDCLRLVLQAHVKLTGTRSVDAPAWLEVFRLKVIAIEELG